MRLRFGMVCLVVTALACSSDLSSPTSANGVQVVATVGNRAQSGDSVTFRITNIGNERAFLQQCGVGPTILVQEYVGSVWTGGVQNFACASSAQIAIPLDPGGVTTVVRVFGSGRFRIRIRVATKSDLSDIALATSNAFDVP